MDQPKLSRKVRVLTPDLPLHPNEVLKAIREICDQEKPDLLVGNSCGSFYAQMVAPIIGVPALLGNPHFKLLLSYETKKERYFCHFKGGKYKYIHSAFDSETQERMVVHQALY